jgi:lipopolysaccharide export system protein LptA
MKPLTLLLYMSLFFYFLVPEKLQAKKGVILSDSIQMFSDRSSINGITNEIENCGHAQIVQKTMVLSAHCLIAKKGIDGYKSFKAVGTPAYLKIKNHKKGEYFYLRANTIDYDVIKQRFIATKNAQLFLFKKKKESAAPLKTITTIKNCLETKNYECLKIASQTISLYHVENNKAIKAEGIISKNTSIQSSKKALVQLEIYTTKGALELKAQSQSLHYLTKTTELTLFGQVTAKMPLGEITAGKFQYNHTTKKSNFERSRNQQILLRQEIPKKKEPSKILNLKSRN